MADREKVIKALLLCIADIEFTDCPYEEIRDAIELLKEQEEQIRQLTEELEELRNKRNEVYYSGYDGSFILQHDCEVIKWTGRRLSIN